jgi:hypothetical protein
MENNFYGCYDLHPRVLQDILAPTQSLKNITRQDCLLQWRRQVSEFGGAFWGQTHIWGGQDIIFKKVLLFAHADVT